MPTDNEEEVMRIRLFVLLALSAFLFAGCPDDHSGHDHDKGEKHSPDDGHKGDKKKDKK